MTDHAAEPAVNPRPIAVRLWNGKEIVWAKSWECSARSWVEEKACPCHKPDPRWTKPLDFDCTYADGGRSPNCSYPKPLPAEGYPTWHYVDHAPDIRSTETS